jgi:hypothetical protein
VKAENMNALVKASPNRTALARTAALDPFADAAEELGGSSAIYLKFNGNSGEYTFGAEAEELPHGTRLAVNMEGFRRGWICWKDEQVVEEIMVRLIDGRPPAKSELTDHGPYVVTEERKDGWSEQAAVNFRDLTTNREYTFKVTSKSALRSLGNLVQDFSKLYKTKPGLAPIVEIGSVTWMPKVKKHGRKHSPVLKIADWIAIDELNATSGDDAGDYENESDGSAEDQPDEGDENVGEEADAPVVETPQEKPTAATVKTTNAPASPGPRRRAF